MMTLMTAWLCTVVAVALGIALDMRWLHVSRVGLSLPGWIVLCVFVGVLAAVPYLILRRRKWLRLLAAATQLSGKASDSLDARRTRLDLLRSDGLIGEPVFRACLKKLDVLPSPTTH